MPNDVPTPTTLFFEEITDDNDSDSSSRLTHGPHPQMTCKTSILHQALFGGGGGSLTLLKNRIYIFGGCSRSGSCSSALTCFDIGTSSCVELGDDHSLSIIPRYGQSLRSHGTKLVLFGGQNAPSTASTPVSFNDLHVYNTQTNTWTCLDRGSAEDESAEEYYGQAIRPMPRNSHSVVVSNAKMFLFGGANAEVGPMDDLWTLDLQTLDEVDDDSCKAGEAKVQWERIGAGDDDDDDDCTSPWPEAREMHSACVVPLLKDQPNGGQDQAGMLLMGGRKADGTALRDMWLLDLQSLEWRQLAEAAQPRCSHTSVYLPSENAVIFFGGWDGAGTIFGDILCFDMTSESWIELDSTAIHGDRIPERFAHSACEDGTGSGLYVVGGVNTENDLQDLVHISIGKKEQR